MAKRQTAKKAGGSVVTSAPESAKGKRTVSSSEAGVKARPRTIAEARKRHASVVAEARQMANKAGVKPVYLCATLDEALAQADRMKDSLTTAGIHAGGRVSAHRDDAEARREWCEKVGAPLVDIAEILHENKKGESVTNRSENVLRSRLQVRGKKVHGNPAYYYAVRASAYRKGEQSLAYLVRL